MLSEADVETEMKIYDEFLEWGLITDFEWEALFTRFLKEYGFPLKSEKSKNEWLFGTSCKVSN